VEVGTVNVGKALIDLGSSINLIPYSVVKRVGGLDMKLTRIAQDIKTPLVPIHIKMCEATLFSHGHGVCEVSSVDPRGCVHVQNDVQGMLDRRDLIVTREDKGKSVCVVTPVFKTRERLMITPNSSKSISIPLVIYLPRPKPYVSQRATPYKYECTIQKNGKEIPLNPSTSMDNITDSCQVLRSERILPAFVRKKTSAPVEEPVPEQNLGKGKVVGKPSGITYEDSDEILKLIKRSEYKVVDQLL